MSSSFSKALCILLFSVASTPAFADCVHSEPKKLANLPEIHQVVKHLPAVSDNLPITNFHHVYKGIYRGGRPDDEGIKSLAKNRFKTVIDLQGGDDSPISLAFQPGERPENIKKEKKLVEKNHMKFIHIPLSSMKDVTKEESAQINKVLKIMSDKKNWPIFIHCEHGNDRTGLITALYKVLYLGKNPIEMYDEMTKIGTRNLPTILVTGAMDRYYYQRTKNIQY